MRFLFTLLFITGIMVQSVQPLQAQLLYRVDSISTRAFSSSANSYRKFHYSHGRGSDVFSQTYQADTTYTWNTYNQPYFKTYCTYNSSDNITSYHLHKYNDTLKKFEVPYDLFYSYDANDNLLLKEDLDIRERMWYDVHNKLVKKIREDAHNNYQVDQIDTFIYNTANQLVCRYTSYILLGDQYMDSLIYDANGYLEKHISYNNYPGPWSLSHIFVYRHDNTGKLIIQDEFNTNSSGIPYPFGRDSFYYDNNGHLLVSYRQLWDAQKATFDTILLSSYQYNQHWLPEVYEITDVTIPSATLSFKERYFYEPYFPAGIEQQQLSADIRLYPVPARDILNLSISFEQPQACTIAIYDMNGRLVRRFNEPSTQRVNRTIFTTDLSPGMYQLYITNREGSMIKAFSVLR